MLSLMKLKLVANIFRLFFEYTGVSKMPPNNFC